MNLTLVRAFAVGAIAIGAATMAHAQQSGPAAQSVDVGKYEYDGHCVACHGLSGKGNGPFAQQLRSGAVVPDITELSKKNNGVFPFARVYEIVDGTVLIMAHGPKDMPIWGRDYEIQSQNLNLNYNPQAFARAKILALTEYVYRLQAK